MAIVIFFLLCFCNFSFKEIIGDPLKTFDFPMSFCNSNLVCITFSMLFLWLYLLSIFGLESFCLFLRVRSSFVDRVLVMMLQVVYGIFPGLGASH